MVSAEAGDAAGARPMSGGRTTSSGGPLHYLVDEHGDPYPPLVQKLILKVLSGVPLEPEWEERLASLNAQIEHTLQVSKAGCIPIHLESLLLEVWEALESLDDELG